MVGFGETYLTAFAEFLRATPLQLSLVATVPQLFASLGQLAAIRLSDWVASRKAVVVASALGQAGLWLAMVAVASAADSVTVLIALATAYHLCGAVATPAWSSWMGDLVPENRRGRYFARRNRIAGIVTTLCVIAAGAILDRMSSIHTLHGFTILFLIASGGRLVSTILLARQYEPATLLAPPNPYRFLPFLRRLTRDNFGVFSLYVMVMMFVVTIASPLFVIFWLRELGFTYFQFMVLVATESVAAFLTMTYWGKHADHYGNKTVLELSSYSIAAVPLLWYLARILPSGSQFASGIAIEVVSGMAWAGFNLSSSNFLYDAVEQPNRLRMVSYYHALRGAAVFAGGLIAGWLGGLGTVAENGTDGSWSGLEGAFLLSAVGRLVVALVFRRKIREARVTVVRLPVLRMVTVLPLYGIVVDTVVGMNRTVQSFRRRLQRLWGEMEEEE